MADNTKTEPTGENGGSAAQKQVEVQVAGQFIKDLSFESPNMERLLDGTGEAPNIQLEINVAAKYLYGATAPGLALEADAILSPTSTLDGYPGYTFGRTDDTMQTYREPLGNVGTFRMLLKAPRQNIKDKSTDITIDAVNTATGEESQHGAIFSGPEPGHD